MKGIRLSALRRELVTVAVAVAIVGTTRTSLADHYFVPSGSMQPTVHIDDHVLVDKLAYGVRLPILDKYVLRFDPPAHGDVVVLESPEDHKVLLKRVVAAPGDRVAVIDGELVIDGRTIPEHEISLAEGGGPDFGPIRVPDGKYLVLGDNRGDSRDGRYFGLVSRDAILGRVEGVFLRGGSPTWITMR